MKEVITDLLPISSHKINEIFIAVYNNESKSIMDQAISQLRCS